MALRARIRRGLFLADGGVPIGGLDAPAWDALPGAGTDDAGAGPAGGAQDRGAQDCGAQDSGAQDCGIQDYGAQEPGGGLDRRQGDSAGREETALDRAESARREAWREGSEAGRQEAEANLRPLVEALRLALDELGRTSGILEQELRESFARRLDDAARSLASDAHLEAVASAAARLSHDATRSAGPGPLVLGCGADLAPALMELLKGEANLKVEVRAGLCAGAVSVELSGARFEALPSDFVRVALAAARGEGAPGPWRAVGTIVRTRGPLLEAEGLRMNLGELAEIGAPEQALLAEAVGFDGGRALLSPLGELRGVGPGERAASLGRPAEIPAGRALLGRVVDALGRPLDDRPLPPGLKRIPVHPLQGMGDPLSLGRVQERFETGVSAIDAFLTCGLGQRLGIFSGSGVGKSTLLGMLARRCRADAVVIGLIGERGREVRDFLERVLGPEGRSRSVVVVATSDQPPALRVQAALTATAMAESLRAEGAQVLLLMDSVTRFAQSLREIGLSLGEPPATRGYPPSVFAALPRLMERAGPLEKGGSITAFYTVLVEGDDMNEPVADAVRGILDGHLVLSRAVAESGRYPAVDVLASLSRCMPEVAGAANLALAQRGRKLFSALEAVRDLVSVGAYREGTDPLVDEARRLCPRIEDMLRQGPEDTRTLEGTMQSLAALLNGGAA